MFLFIFSEVVYLLSMLFFQSILAERASNFLEGGPSHIPRISSVLKHFLIPFEAISILNHSGMHSTLEENYQEFELMNSLSICKGFKIHGQFSPFVVEDEFSFSSSLLDKF